MGELRMLRSPVDWKNYLLTAWMINWGKHLVGPVQGSGLTQLGKCPWVCLWSQLELFSPRSFPHSSPNCRPAYVDGIAGIPPGLLPNVPLREFPRFRFWNEEEFKTAEFREKLRSKMEALPRMKFQSWLIISVLLSCSLLIWKRQTRHFCRRRTPCRKILFQGTSSFFYGAVLWETCPIQKSRHNLPGPLSPV